MWAEEAGLVLWELSVVEQRSNAVMEVLRVGQRVVEVADRYGVSRQAVHRWLRRYQDGGLEALEDRSHRPRSCPHQLAEAAEAVLVELRRAHPGWGPRRLGHELARREITPLPSRAVIYRALVRNGLVEPHARRRRKTAWRRWQRQRPMQLWQMDVMGGLRLVDGREAKLVTGIDDHSRFCVAAGVVAHATARAVCQVFAAALARHGIPEELLTDNGKVFTGRFAPHPGEVLFDRICRENGIIHRLTAPRSPTTTGKVERFHKTLRTELLDGLRFDSLTQAQQVIDAWVTDYNTRRPHQALGMATPAQRFQLPADSSMPPQPPLVVAQEPASPAGRLRPTGSGEIARLVHSNGVIVVTRQVCSVGRRYAGQQVTVMVEPNLLHVFCEGVYLKTIPRTTTGEVTQIRAHRHNNHRPVR
jgi:transposase InsO family protein